VRERREGTRRSEEASDVLWHFIKMRGRVETRGYGAQPWWGALWCMEYAWRNDEHVVCVNLPDFGSNFSIFYLDSDLGA
jgi:hypothetical protein